MIGIWFPLGVVGAWFALAVLTKKAFICLSTVLSSSPSGSVAILILWVVLVAENCLLRWLSFKTHFFILLHVAWGRRTSKSWKWHEFWDGTTMIDKGMKDYFVKCQSFFGCSNENFWDEIFCILRYRYVIREGVVIFLNPLISELDIIGFKRWLSNYEGISTKTWLESFSWRSLHHNTQRPYVDFIRMSNFSVKNFRGDVIWSSANCSFLLSIKFELGSKPKISEFYLHILINKEISQL